LQLRTVERNEWEERVMRLLGVLAVTLLFLSPLSAAAQGWFEYVNQEDRFSVNFPSQPEISDQDYLSASGASIPARKYETSDGDARYTVTVVDYSDAVPEDKGGAIQHAADSYRNSGGEVTYDNAGGVDGIDGHMMQLTNADESRSFVQIAYHLDRLYVVDATVPAGSIVPGHFQQSLVMLDDQGRRVRFQTNEQGERYRVIPNSGGEPFVE
jgi:hypothetical protein